MIESLPYKRPIPSKRKHIKDIKLVKAAVHVDAVVYTGWRHSEIMCYLRENKLTTYVGQDAQGFVDQDGNFYRREACGCLAFLNGQTKECKSPLLSEHLWDVDGNPI